MDVSLRLPFARLARTPRAWVAIVAWMLLAIVAASVLHHAGSSATEVALGSIFAALALPLLCFAVAGAVLGGDSLSRSSRALVAFGVPPMRMALSTALAAIASCAVLAAVVGALVAAIAHGPGDPSIARDAFTSAWVAGLGGAAYGALFTFGASFGKHGGGRVWALVLDWVLGSGTGAAGLCTPRAHVRSLLGGDSVMTLSGRASAVALVTLVLGFSVLAVARTRRP